MPTVIVNNLTIVHRASGGVSMAFPDPCKTPMPPGSPVPIPYPNVAMSTDTADGSASVKMEGNSIMLKSSCFALSTGDEAGTALGVVSNKTKGKAYPRLYSFDVKVEGQNVFRQSDLMLQNGGSPTNTPPGTEMQAPGAPALDAPSAPASKSEASKPPTVTKLELTPKSCCCGDRVTTRVQTKNIPDGEQVVLQVESTGATPLPALVAAEITGDQGDVSWDVQRGAYHKAVSWRLNALATGGNTQSNDIEIKTAPPASQLVIGERRTPQFSREDGTFVWKNGRYYGWQYAYEIAIRAGELTITRKVEFVREPELFGLWRVPARTSSENKKAWKREIEKVWDRKFQLHRAKCVRGEDCNCASDAGCCVWSVRIRCDFAPAGPGIKPVRLHPGANDPNGWGGPKWWYSHDWWEQAVGVPRTVRAHEFGHLIGMYDEYPAGACDPERKYISDETCVMSVGGEVYERHFEAFRAWFEEHSSEVVGPVGFSRG